MYLKWNENKENKICLICIQPRNRMELGMAIGWLLFFSVWMTRYRSSEANACGLAQMS